MISLFSKFKRRSTHRVVKIIMGLGNPGANYHNNRHNFGFMVLDRFAELRQLNFRRGNSAYLWCEDTESLRDNGTSVILAKPLTFMNKSGVAARQLLRHFDVKPDRLLVVYDDIDLPLGRIRIRKSGSPGGHKGVKSISESLQTTGFPRLRLGIGPQRPGVPSEEFVLEDFRTSEQIIAAKVINLCVEILREFVNSEIDNIMSRYNNIDLCDIKKGVT